MTECKFKVGEVCRGRSGFQYKIIAIDMEASPECRLVVRRIDLGYISARRIDGRTYVDRDSDNDILPNKRKEWVVTYKHGGRDYVAAHATENSADYSVADLEERNARAVEHGNPPPYTEIRGPFPWESED